MRVKSLLLPMAALFGLTLAGCTSVSEWISPSEEDPAAELQDFEARVSVDTLWTRGVGAGSEHQRLHLVPILVGDRLFVAAGDGSLAARDVNNGRVIWEVDLDAPLSGGPGVGEGLVVIGTTDAEIIAVSAVDGSLQWRSGVSSEVLSTPVVSAGRVVVSSIDGRIDGLDARTGERVWRYERKIPTLTLRGTGSPILSGDRVICGMSGGKLVSLDVQDGAVRWDASVSVPSGRSELERLADIDGDPLVRDGIIYAASYQGEVAALEESSGTLLWRRPFSSYSRMDADRYNVYASDAEGTLWALDADNGSARWRQEALNNRQLSDVSMVAGAVAVGDFEGYVHFLSPDDGSLIGRTRVGSGAITRGMLAKGDVLYVLGGGGELAALRVTPL